MQQVKETQILSISLSDITPFKQAIPLKDLCSETPARRDNQKQINQRKSSVVKQKQHQQKISKYNEI